MLANEKISDEQRRYAEDLAITHWGSLDMRMEKPAPRIVNDRAPWFIVNSEPRRETVAEKSLRKEGFDCFYPTRNVTVVPHRNKVTLKMRSKLHLLAKSVDRPIFAGYLFVRPGVENPGVRTIFGMRGVIGLVHFGERLALVKNDLVESLRSGEAKKLLEEHFSSTPFPYKIGDKAILKDGALAEHTAIIERVDESAGTIHALVRLFGRACRVVTSVEQLEKIA